MRLNGLNAIPLPRHRTAHAVYGRLLTWGAVVPLLSSARGALPPPLRDEGPGSATPAQRGHTLGLAHGEPAPVGQAQRAAPFFPRLRENIEVLHEAHRTIAQQELNGRHVSPAGEWLLENIHLVVAQTREVHDGLPRRYFRGLPVLVTGPWAGLPRVYAIAWSYVAQADSAFAPVWLTEFLRGYQTVHTLTQGELWALPTTLRVVLVENLRRLAERVAAEEAAREAAHRLCDGLNPQLDAPDNSAATLIEPRELFARLKARGVMRAFALQVMQRLHADSETGTVQGARSREQIRLALADALPEPAAAQAGQQAEQTADNLSVGNAIRSLQLLGSADWRGLISQASVLVRGLLAWPAFAAERDDTQDLTLHAIEALARRSKRSEWAAAEVLLNLARQPMPADATGQPPPHGALGYWLQGDGAPTLREALGLRAGWSARQWQRAALPLLLGTLALGTVLLTAWFVRAEAVPGLGTWGLLGVALLAFWPASETVVAAVNRLVSESVPPHRLSRLALADGIPAEHAVLVVMPALLGDTATLNGLIHRLELHHLANREHHAQFALLTDFGDADTETTPADPALLAQALAAINALELRHAHAPDATHPPGSSPVRRFLLLHRPRHFSVSEQRFIGWERKRGKLEQLVELLARSLRQEAAGSDESPSAFIDLGAASRPHPGTPYILTLDSDTVLPPGALRELVGIAAHPLNRPRVDAAQGCVVAGYGILQPRIVAAWPLDAEGRTRASYFHRLFAGSPGSDPYNAVASEVYQDLFEEGSFTGKGLLDVAALHAVLAKRLPQDQVLSHDLLEGCIARCGSVSDVAVIEPAPAHPDLAASRVHRWTRGDWQLLPLLLSMRLRPIARWKLLDNLRRSLVAPAALALMLLGLMGTAVSPWAALALAAAAFGVGPLVGAIAGLAPSRDDLALRHFARVALRDLLRTVLGLLWHAAMWLRQSVLLLDAITRALWRSLVSRRSLLQWTTAAAAEAATSQNLWRLMRQHARVSLLAVVLAAVLLAVGTPTPGLVLLMCGLWALTPLWVTLGSCAPHTEAELSPEDRRYLTAVARDTWAWFALHVNESSNHLPPDNVQTVPRTMVANRTSPTNIGLYLLALACARSFGWIGSAQMADRLQATLDTLDRLPRERGHLMNWIDTQSLRTLPPAYVSSVDSGNLCGHLLAVASACEEAADETEVGVQQRTLAHLPAAMLDALSASPLDPQDPARDLPDRLRTLARRCRHFAEAADFSFLYDRRRRLLHIGWRVAEQQLDAGHYDLLASESRLASLWAIAKGDVPATHWAALGRPFQATTTQVGLRSWSGSMFEYLMPTLVLDEPRGTVLACAARMAVHEQRAFAHQQHLPWGVSESAYAAADRSLAYQYAPQGVPRLALRRTPPDERVVAPYATALAAMVKPHAAVQNLRRLQALHARGAWGFIEALDYTPSRQAEVAEGVVLSGAEPPIALQTLAANAPAEATRADPNQRPCMPVSTYMAHHQGMTVVALANVLLQGLPRRWGMADPRLAAVSALLQERVPREVARLLEPDSGLQGRDPAGNRSNSQDRRDRRHAREVRPGEHALQRTQMLSNGHYSVTLRANGAGGSRLGAVDITRHRDDALRDSHGSFLYVKRLGQLNPVSLTQHPAPDPNAHYSAQFHADRVVLEATWPDLRSRITVWMSPEDDVELRRVELWNTSSRPLTLDLFSAFEVCLSEARADEMHPAFANLFISAEWNAEQQALRLKRKARREDESTEHRGELQAVHFVADAQAGSAAIGVAGDLGEPVRVLADRARWLGRLREAWQPLADFDAAGSPSGPCSTGLDPVAALALRVHLPPHGMAHLTLGTAASTDAAQLDTWVARYRDPAGVERASQMSATLAALRQREQRLPTEDWLAVQTLTTLLVQLHTRPAAGDGAGLAGAGSTGSSAGSSASRSTVGSLGSVAADAALALSASAVVANRQLLWRFGLSGDKPLIVVTVSATHGLRLVRLLVQGLQRWAWGGVPCDLVLINGEARSYLQPLQHELVSLREGHLTNTASERPGRAGGLVLLQADELTAAERHTFALLARVRLNADGRPLAQHVADLVAWHDAAQASRDACSAADIGRTVLGGGAPALLDSASIGATGAIRPVAPAGHFDPHSGHYSFQARLTQPPQRPWVNVLANPAFGALVSEAGAGCSWAGNSRLHQLTPWNNDTLGDNTGELFCLQDLRTRDTWTLGAGPGAAAVDYRVSHGPGITQISHRRGDVAVQVSWTVHPVLACKQVRVCIRHHASRETRLRLVGLVEWLMGAVRVDRQSVRTRCLQLNAPLDVLLATQLDDHDGAAGKTAFMTLHQEPSAALGIANTPRAPDGRLQEWTCDRREFFDSRGRRVLPDQLSQRSGDATDPCAALGVTLHLPADGEVTCVFTLGHGDTPQAALALAGRVHEEATAHSGTARSPLLSMTPSVAPTLSPQPPQTPAQQQALHWQALAGALTVQTPDPAFDALVNHWLLYQTVACRLWGRAGFYQAGGAFGFRDQLQDAMALVLTAPHLLREHLLRAAARQFVQGDVQHWWHPHSGAGVRTHFGDDLLWLPHATAHYLHATADHAVLDERVPFIEGDAVPAGAEDLYAVPRISAEHGSLYEHGARAIDRSLAVGEHGLPLMGGGDWNDGMNRVGAQGRGESVWLAWFLLRVVADWLPLAQARGDNLRCSAWQQAAQGWRAALDGPAWDGDWYQRAFFDDGSPLGSSANAECRIDLIAQAWSVLAGDGASAHRQQQAMGSAERLLFDQAHGLLRLLDPPLQHAHPNAGYIQAYPPGVRENGGQYNHGATWAVMAWAQLGQADAAWRAWVAISPAHRAAHPEQGLVYGLEPYAVAADVYSQPPYTGRGGWSWYTGSAAGLYRAAVHAICGLDVQGQRLRFMPMLPSHWPVVQLTLRRGGKVHRFTLCAHGAKAEIAQAQAEGAQAWPTATWLDLAPLEATSHHLLMCGPAAPANPNTNADNTSVQVYRP